MVTIDLSGKIAIVTGAGQGLGQCTATVLHAAGANVVINFFDDPSGGNRRRAEETAARLGERAVAIAADVRDGAQIRQMFAVAEERFGQVNIVVNNAGATKRGEFVELTEEDWADGFALKFFGAVRVTRAAWPHLRESHGSVIHISGIGGRTPGAQFAIGGSVNAALLSFTKALAEMGLRDGVQVNCISPGTIRTERYSKRLETMAREQGIAMNEAEAAFVKAQRVSRIGEPSEIAGMVAYLVTEGRFLHGSIIDIDGGATKTV